MVQPVTEQENPNSQLPSSSLQVHAGRVGEVLVDVLEGAGRAEEVVDGAVEALLAVAVLQRVIFVQKCVKYCHEGPFMYKRLKDKPPLAA